MVSLTIDGKNTTVPKGTTILDAAATIGIRIPTLCWLKKVSPTGACRVCVVEIEGIERPQTACNTPVKDGIVVTTVSERLTSIRKRMVELLLVNHPLDCPVCDAGGECDLQDSCYEFAVARQDYSAILDRKPIRYDWPLIESDPNRCILCEKCVKVDHEIVRADAIEVSCRGEGTIIDTKDGKPLNCEFCGNCVAVCPVGALLHKPYKFKGRPWHYTETKSTCAFCAAGCEVTYHTRNGRVERVSSEDSNFNSGNLCINGRYGYGYLNSDQRLTVPLVRNGSGIHENSTWNAALDAAAERLKAIREKYGADAIAAITSPRLTNEEQQLLAQFMNGAVGTGNVGSEASFGYAAAVQKVRTVLGSSALSASIDRIDKAGAVLVLGSDLNAESTGVEYRVIKATTKHDARLVVANMRDVKLKPLSNAYLKYRPGSELLLLNGLAKVLLEEGLSEQGQAQGLEALQTALKALSLQDVAKGTGIDEGAVREAARTFAGKGSLAIIVGIDMIRSPEAAAVMDAVMNLALLTGAAAKEQGGVFIVDEKTNSRGLIEALPTAGNLQQILDGIQSGKIKALYAVGSDLARFPKGAQIREALKGLELFIAQDIFPSDTFRTADFIFPAAAAPEKNGTFTALDGRTSSVAKAGDIPGIALPDGEIFAALIERCGGATAASASSAAQAASAGSSTFAAPSHSATAGANGKLLLLTGPILYHNGSMSTWSAFNREVSAAPYIQISAEDAAALGVSDGAAVTVSSAAGKVSGQVQVSAKVQQGLLFAPYHFPEMPVSALLEGNANIVPVTVQKA